MGVPQVLGSKGNAVPSDVVGSRGWNEIKHCGRCGCRPGAEGGVPTLKVRALRPFLLDTSSMISFFRAPARCG